VRRPFTLIADGISTDTVTALEQLLEQARAGEIIGVAFAVMLKRRNYVVNATGEARRNATFARGMLAALDDQLGAKIRGEAAV